MRMEYLRYLLEVQKQHSIAAAAETLYLGQTTLRTIIKNVENELGVTIFRRAYKGVDITPEGEEALVLMEEINALFGKILLLGSPDDGNDLPVSIVLSPTINSVLAVPVTKRFLHNVPEGDLNFYTVPGQEVGTLIIKGGGNIGLAYLSDDNFETYRMVASRYQIEVHRLYRDNQYLVVSRQHPLFGRSRIPYSEVKNFDFAMLPHYVSQEHSEFTRAFGPGNRYTTYSSISLVKQAVVRENMATVLPGFCVLHDAGEKIHTLLLTDSDGETRRETNLCLIHRQLPSLNDPEKILIRCIREYFSGLASPQSPSQP